MAEDRLTEGGTAHPNTGHGIKRGLWALGSALVLVLAVEIWASEKVTLQGERTVYTVDCERGVWQASRCSGRLVPAARYRFRALKRRREVLFWEVGASAPSPNDPAKQFHAVPKWRWWLLRMGVRLGGDAADS